MTYMDPLIVTGALAGLLSLAIAHKCLRRRFNVRVNCWYCNKNTVVPYGNSNCWDCPHCDQYNGFNKNGDLNKPVPAQYDETLNYPVTCKPADFVTGDGLCESCNKTQSLKIHNLANFVPSNEKFYEHEVTAYRDHLEYTYSLCKSCEKKVHLEINKQDRLIHKKLNKSYKEYLSQGIGSSQCQDHLFCKMKTPFHIRIVQLISVLCAITVTLVNIHHLQTDSKTYFFHFEKYISDTIVGYMESLQKANSAIIMLGLTAGFFAIFLHGRHRTCLLDAICSLTWLFLLFSQAANTLLKVHRKDLNVIQTCLAVFNSIINVLSSLYHRPYAIQSRLLRSTLPAVSSSLLSSQSSDTQLNNDHDELDSQLETMSIGPPTSSKSSGFGVFNVKHFSHGIHEQHAKLKNQSTLDALMLRQRKLLIQPAKLNMSSKKCLKKDQPLINSEEVSSAENEGQSDQISNHSNGSFSSSSSSSVCPVGTTCPSEIASNEVQPVCTQLQEGTPIQQRSLLGQCLLGFSIGFNVFFFMYLLIQNLDVNNILQILPKYKS